MSRLVATTFHLQVGLSCHDTRGTDHSRGRTDSPSRMQGAVLETLHNSLSADIGPAQQMEGPTPSPTVPQPGPPQIEQARGQQTCPLLFSMPGRPLLHFCTNPAWPNRTGITPHTYAGWVSRNTRICYVWQKVEFATSGERWYESARVPIRLEIGVVHAPGVFSIYSQLAPQRHLQRRPAYIC